MPGFKNKITTRRVSLGFIILVLGMMFLSTTIPQKMVTSQNQMSVWRQGHKGILWLIDSANLHRIYAQPWFALAILCASVSLGISSWDQLAIARKRLHASGAGSAEEIAGDVAEEDLRAVAGSHRYRAFETSMDDRLKFVKNPWGYYGNSMLHFGMVLAVAASLYVALTGRQGALLLVEGTTNDQVQPWTYAEQGILAKPLEMPGSVGLEKLRVSFDAKNQPSIVSSDIAIFCNSGNVDRLTSTINIITNYRGLRIYHAAQYGDAFTIEFTDEKGTRHFEKLPIQQPAGLTVAGYGDFELSWSPYLLSAKYYTDVDNKSMTSSNPQLVLRLLDGNREVNRVSLTSGRTVALGNYMVKLVGIQKWSKLIFVDITGMPVIFLGFAVIMLGGLVQYMSPARELIAIRHQNGQCEVYWNAQSFREFFLDERDEIAIALKKEATG